MTGWVVLLSVTALADGPATQPAETYTYKNKVRSQAWFNEQYESQKYNFEKDRKGKWRDVGCKVCKMKDEGIDESYPVGTIAKVAEDFKFIYLIKSIKGKDVIVHKAFNPVDRVYVQPTPQNRFTSKSTTDMKHLTINGKTAMNTSWTFDFMITGYSEGRNLKVGQRVTGVFVCEKNDYKNGNMPVWSEIRPITPADFKEILASNSLLLYDYSVKTTEKTVKGKYRKLERIIIKPAE
jgi:hypothetical protein